MDVSKCRSCGADIVWVVMRSGKRMPLDVKPGKGIVLDIHDDRAQVMDVYTSHFATCPDAAQHRKPKLPGVE